MAKLKKQSASQKSKLSKLRVRKNRKMENEKKSPKKAKETARERNRKRMAKLREDDDQRAAENKRRKDNPSTNVKAKTRMAAKREDDDQRAAENKRRIENPKTREKDQQRKAQKRKSSDVLSNERFKKRQKRSIPENVIEENAQRRRVRNQPKNRKNVMRVNRERIKDSRRSALFRAAENVKLKYRMRTSRQKKEVNNLKKDILAFRKRWEAELRQSKDQKSKILLKFMDNRAQTPKFICICCEGLFFRKSMRKVNLATQNRLRPANTPFKTDWICSTCRTHDMKDKTKLPRMAVDNGFQFHEIPRSVRDLTPLEERLVSPILSFMQIRPLMPHSLNPQLGLKGSVVNVPVEVPEMINSLPRTFDNMGTVQVKLKRHVDHRSDYMFETVRPWKLREVMEYFQEQELYKKFGIKLNEEFICTLEQLQKDGVVDFVINQNDLIVPNNPEPSEKANDDTSEQNQNAIVERSKHDIAEFFNNNENDIDEVLLIDQNLETAENAITVIAPGQGKRPLPWLIYPNLDELCFPKTFLGQSFNTNNESYTCRTKSELRRAGRRSCVPTRVLFMAKQKIERECFSCTYTCMRRTKSKDGRAFCAKDLLNKDFMNDAVKHNDGYHFLKNVRGTPAYWESVKKVNLAMIRQIGAPTFFITISPGERIRLELLQVLVKYHLNKDITLEEAAELDDNVITDQKRSCYVRSLF